MNGRVSQTYLVVCCRGAKGTSVNIQGVVDAYGSACACSCSATKGVHLNVSCQPTERRKGCK
jgi:hypothetical protein